MWDVTELDEVCEVLNLTNGFGDTGSSARDIPIFPKSGAILPSRASPSGRRSGSGVAAGKGKEDEFEDSRPLLGVLLSSAELVVYSLAEHQVVKRVSVFGPSVNAAEYLATVVDCGMQAGEQFIAISVLVSELLSLIFRTR